MCRAPNFYSLLWWQDDAHDKIEHGLLHQALINRPGQPALLRGVCELYNSRVSQLSALTLRYQLQQDVRRQNLN